jgi:predicted site-specific integrase-resolvase
MTRFCPEVPDFCRLSAKEVCSMLEISFNTLKRRVEEGKIAPSFYSHGKPFYWGKDVKALWRNW